MTIVETICAITNKTYRYKYVNNNSSKFIQSHGYCYLAMRNYLESELSDVMGLDDNRLYRRYAIKHKIFKYEHPNSYR